ncbi:uncharacterized protein [Drosophila pseudoobscura]|uniref:Uncharacterized protein n=1 Tax=Drosophila pseudoobscura pseudoobscura TaxID=46245 RepID=A0A6I8W591_DROPS|nr:uncharacterized protein LOC117184521 [Drosophila pseudoobscura]
MYSHSMLHNEGPVASAVESDTDADLLLWHRFHSLYGFEEEPKEIKAAVLAVKRYQGANIRDLQSRRQLLSRLLGDGCALRLWRGPMDDQCDEWTRVIKTVAQCSHRQLKAIKV